MCSGIRAQHICIVDPADLDVSLYYCLVLGLDDDLDAWELLVLILPCVVSHNSSHYRFRLTSTAKLNKHAHMQLQLYQKPSQHTACDSNQ